MDRRAGRATSVVELPLPIVGRMLQFNVTPLRVAIDPTQIALVRDDELLHGLPTGAGHDLQDTVRLVRKGLLFTMGLARQISVCPYGALSSGSLLAGYISGRSRDTLLLATRFRVPTR